MCVCVHMSDTHYRSDWLCVSFASFRSLNLLLRSGGCYLYKTVKWEMLIIRFFPSLHTLPGWPRALCRHERTKEHVKMSQKATKSKFFCCGWLWTSVLECLLLLLFFYQMLLTLCCGLLWAYSRLFASDFSLCLIFSKALICLLFHMQWLD